MTSLCAMHAKTPPSRRQKKVRRLVTTCFRTHVVNEHVGVAAAFRKARGDRLQWSQRRHAYAAKGRAA